MKRFSKYQIFTKAAIATALALSSGIVKAADPTTPVPQAPAGTPAQTPGPRDSMEDMRKRLEEARAAQRAQLEKQMAESRAKIQQNQQELMQLQQQLQQVLASGNNPQQAAELQARISALQQAIQAEMANLPTMIRQ